MMPEAAVWERTDVADPCLDFCLWPYPPPSAGAGKLRSLTLLSESFRLCGVEAQGAALVERLRQGVGLFTCVFGIKWMNGELKWELYFYDYGRLERERSVSLVLDVMRPLIPCDVVVNEELPYFMFSLDVTVPMLQGRVPLEEVHVYVGNPGSAVSSGICYSVTKDATILENFYFFFDATRQMAEIVAKASCSAYVDASFRRLDDLLWPGLRECQTIVVANKRRNDGLYFSRITVDQLLVFLERFDYPRELVALVSAQRAGFDHLLYDVGFDYRVEGDQVRLLKSGFYGVF